MLGDLLEEWGAFSVWVLSLQPPERYLGLRELATTGRAAGVNELGLELANALDASPDLTADARAAAESLGEAILWRKVQWASGHVRKPAFWPPPDPAVLVVLTTT
jgi:hypothetical protein